MRLGFMLCLVLCECVRVCVRSCVFCVGAMYICAFVCARGGQGDGKTNYIPYVSMFETRDGIKRKKLQRKKRNKKQKRVREQLARPE